MWHTGSNGNEISSDNINTSKFYEIERGSNTGKICSSGGLCNDTVERTTLWTGKIGLIYPSDYGYATSGTNLTTRTSCLSSILYQWSDDINKHCYLNNWLYKDKIWRWTITPVSHSSQSLRVYRIHPNGQINSMASAYGAFNLFPVLYLKSNITIVFGLGTEDNPFILNIQL